MEYKKVCYNLETDLFALYNPLPEESIVEWCERSVYLAEGTSQETGYIRFDSRPWQKEILEAYANPEIRNIYLKASAQISKTVLMSCCQAWRIANANTSLLWVWPNFAMAQNFQETRLNPILSRIPEIQNKIAKQNDDKKTIKLFSDGNLRLCGQGNETNIASAPVQALFLDEVSKYRKETEESKEANPVKLAIERTASFPDAKIFQASSPNQNDDAISILYASGDQRVYEMPCPHCNPEGTNDNYFAFLFEYIHFPDTKDKDGFFDVDKVEKNQVCKCPFCNKKILDGHKPDMLNKGRWKPLNPNAPSHTRSYYINRLYSPYMTFQAMAKEYATEYNEGSTKNFKNSWLGLSWANEVNISEKYSQEKRLINDELISTQKSALIMSIDVQGDYSTPYFYWIIREWFKDGNSKAIAKGKQEDITALNEIQKKYKVEDWNVIIDFNYNPATVVNIIQENHLKQIVISGKKTFVSWNLANGRQVKNGFIYNGNRNNPYKSIPHKLGNGAIINRIVFVPDRFKDILALLRTQKSKIGSWWISPEVQDDVYCRHLNAEKRQQKKNGDWGWIMPDTTSARRANHYLDCEVLSLVLARFYGYIKF